MERNTVIQLKAKAKERGLKGYSKLKKAGLINLLTTQQTPTPMQHTPPAQPTAITNVINTYVKPTLREVKKAFDWTKKKSIGIRDFISKNLNELIDWAKKPSVPKEKPSLAEFVKEELKERVESFKITESTSALKKFTVQYTIDGRIGYDPESFFNNVRQTVTNLLKNNRETKIKLILRCIMEKTDIATGETTTQPAAFNSNVEVNLEGTDINDLYNTMVDRAQESMAAFQREGSNWMFKSIISLEIHSVKYEPLKGSSYIPLPSELTKKKAIINMKNEDDQCFKWCVSRALNLVEKNAERITKELRERSEHLNWVNIKFPVDLKTIDKFERQNATISVNVFGYEGEVYPLRLSKHERGNIINLLLISDGEKQHYCLIKNMSRLLSTQTSKIKWKRHFCLRCLNSFTSKESLEKHEEYCKTNAAIKIELPEKGTQLEFKNFVRSMKVPFVVYADFEAFTQPLETSQPNPDNSYTNQYQKHTPSGFGYYIKCFDDTIYAPKYVSYTKKSEDDDVAQIFVDTLEQDIKDIYRNKFKFPKKIVFTKADQKAFDEATKCWICNNDLGKDKVRDHCHFSAKFRGAAHNECNLRYRKPKFIPVIFHNLSGYDSHLFIKNLGVSEGNIECIPNNEDKYISFTKTIVVDEFTNKEGKKEEVKKQLRFIDSFKFMASSLESLVNNLTDCGKCDSCKPGSCLKRSIVNGKIVYHDTIGPCGKCRNCKLVTEHCQKPTDVNLIETKTLFKDKIKLLMRKGIYPYDYMNCIQKLDDKQLPPKSSFYSRLNNTDISDEEYEHARAVWKEFGTKTMREFHDLYLTSDVLLLADVFENFRDVCLKNYELDPAWYYTAPGLAWDAALKLTAVKLELLSDPDMLLMVEKGIRGGISTISTRYGKAKIRT